MATTTSGRVRVVVCAVLFVVIAVAFQLLRQPGARTWNTVWAEDGGIYASDAYAHSASSTLFRGYAGYAQLVPRLIALGIRPLPVSWIAPYFAITTAVVTALLAVFVYYSMAGWVRSRWLRASMAAMAALAPVMFFEINANIANLGWLLLFASMWALASRRSGALDTAVRAVVVAATALTTPLVVLLVPGAIALTLVRRRRDDAVVLATTFVALGVQWLAIRAAPPTSSGPSSLRDLPTQYGVRVVASMLVGQRWLGWLWEQLGGLLVVLSIAALLAIVVCTLPWRVDADRRWFAASAVAFSLVLFALPVWIRGTEAMRLVSGTYTDAGSRYALVPLLILLSGLVVLIDGSGRRWLEVGTVVVVAVVILAGFGLRNARSNGPDWSTQLAAGRRTCAQANHPATVAVPITPYGLGWYVTVPCGRLREYAVS